jgi:hypothetical protein
MPDESSDVVEERGASAPQPEPTAPRNRGQAVEDQLRELDREREARGKSVSKPGLTERLKQARAQVKEAIVPPPGTYQKVGRSYEKVTPQAGPAGEPQGGGRGQVVDRDLKELADKRAEREGSSASGSVPGMTNPWKQIALSSVRFIQGIQGPRKAQAEKQRMHQDNLQKGQPDKGQVQQPQAKAEEPPPYRFDGPAQAERAEERWGFRDSTEDSKGKERAEDVHADVEQSHAQGSSKWNFEAFMDKLEEEQASSSQQPEQASSSQQRDAKDVRIAQLEGKLKRMHAGQEWGRERDPENSPSM